MILSTGLHSYIFILEYHNDKNMLILLTPSNPRFT